MAAPIGRNKYSTIDKDDKRKINNRGSKRDTRQRRREASKRKCDDSSTHATPVSAMQTLISSTGSGGEQPSKIWEYPSPTCC